MRNKSKWHSILLIGLIVLLASSMVACGQPITHISAKQDEISFVARAGDEPVSEALEIHSSAIGEPLMWEAEDDALWLEVQPDRGTFDSGVSNAVIWVDTSGMSVGHHNATISIFVSEADNSPLSIPVRLHVETPEDPAVVAAREFWESSYYKEYWDFNAADDIRDAVRSYSFPPPGETKEISQEIEFRGHKFEYNPEIYERPTAIVHCIITWRRTYEEAVTSWIETWTADWDVVLEVEPGPYHIDHNEWKIIDYYRHQTE